jgi:transcriptional regulator with XRE-family HTH domain
MKKLTQKELGNILRRIRTSKNLSQADLARLIKVTPNSISAIERGLTYPSIPFLMNIASALGCSISSLLGEEEIQTVETDLSLRLIARIKSLLQLIPEETLIKYLDALIELCKETKEQVSKSNS